MQLLQPHRVTTFKVSNDPHFTDKLIDIGSTSTRRNARSCQIQALDRTQATLPMPAP